MKEEITYTKVPYSGDTYDNDTRLEVTNNTGKTKYVLYLNMGGSGFSIRELNGYGTWREGADELYGVYDTEEEAKEALAKI